MRAPSPNPDVNQLCGGGHAHKQLAEATGGIRSSASWFAPAAVDPGYSRTTGDAAELIAVRGSTSQEAQMAGH